MLNVTSLVKANSGYTVKKAVAVKMGAIMQLNVTISPTSTASADAVVNPFSVDDSLRADLSAVMGNDYVTGQVVWNNYWCVFQKTIAVGREVALTSGAYFHL